MGAWGSGNLDNDGALDWLEEFKARKSIRALQKKLKNFPRAPESADEVLACAEIIAALNGYPSYDIPPEIEEWTEKQRKKTPPDLCREAGETVQSILKESDLKSLWEETEHFNDWRAIEEDLLSRLTRAPLPLDGPKVRKPPILRVLGTLGGDPVKIKLGAKLPDLSKPLGAIGAPRMVTLPVGNGVLPEELLKLSAWLQN